MVCILLAGCLAIDRRQKVHLADDIVAFGFSLALDLAFHLIFLSNDLH